MKAVALLATAALLVPQPAAADICPATSSDAATLVMTLTPTGGANYARGPRIFGRAPVNTQVFYSGNRIRRMRIAIPAAPTYDYAAGLTAGQKGRGLAACDTDGVCIWGPSSPAADGELDSITVEGDREGKLAMVVCEYVVN